MYTLSGFDLTTHIKSSRWQEETIPRRSLKKIFLTFSSSKSHNNNALVVTNNSITMSICLKPFALEGFDPMTSLGNGSR
jgi:hypothetical protein